ncbi:MAG: hypothetical protein ACAI35_11505 [Candidatus Methylacidiphilales bacterium]|nr:hypothetical protein [Candidatus Methylacidiphilales bacterium]
MTHVFLRRIVLLSLLALWQLPVMTGAVVLSAHAAGTEEPQQPRPSTPSNELMAQLKEAEQKLNKKDFAGATKVLDQAITKEPHYFGYYLRAAAKGASGDYNGALDDVNHAIRIGGSTVPALMMRGKLYVRVKEYAKGVEDYKLVVQDDMRDPIHKNIEAVRYLGVALFCKGGDDETAGNFLSMALSNSEDAEEKLYSCYFLWCIHARHGKQQLWADTLKNVVDAEEKRLNAVETEANAALPETAKPAAGTVPSAASKSWSLKVGRFLSDELSETDLLAAAQSPEAETTANQLCEAHYYIGMKQLGKGHKDEAAVHLNKAVETKAMNMVEITLAEAELLQLKNPAEPAAPAI